MPAPTNRDIDGALSAAQWSPEVIAAQQLALARGGGGLSAARAAAARKAIKKVALPLDLGLHAVEVTRLASSQEVRDTRVAEAEDLARSSAARRTFAAVENPVGLIYGTAAIANETRNTINDPRIRDQDLEYLRWRAERDFAEARSAREAGALARAAGAQQQSRSRILAQKSRARILEQLRRPEATPLTANPTR